MAVQDKSVVTDLNSIVMPSSCLCLGPKAPSQPTELSLSGEEHGLKVRKAYTITKQRERWTEEEHKKFLEALKLYGRAWRRIEEHIGSKNAVQIRSHAQKFFSKVVRESACSSAGTVKPIEIPPPRPKRKPMHPYPRKQGHSSNKGIQPVLQQNERSISMTPSSDQENRSPKSVLSAVGSDIMGSSFTNLQNCCNSPDSSGTGSNPVGSMPREQEDICQSRFSSDEEENGSNYQSKGENGSSILGSATDMKLDSISVDNFFSKEGSSVEAPATSLKLFGRTVMIPNSHRPSSSVGGNTLQSHKSSPSIDNGSHQKTTGADLQSTAQATVERDFCGAACESAWNSWPYGVPPLFYCMPFQNESMNSAEAPAGASLALPWWSLCGGLPFPLIHPSNISLQQNPPESCTGSPDHKEMMHKDGSSTGSDTTSVSEYGPAVKNCHIVDSETIQPSSMAFQLKASKNSAFTSMKSGASNRPARGFVPYKRCLSRKRSVEVADWQ